MNTFYPVYICEDYSIDYNVNNRVLFIEKPVLIGMVQTVEQFNSLVENKKYNAVVCPYLISNAQFDYIEFIN